MNIRKAPLRKFLIAIVLGSFSLSSSAQEPPRAEQVLTLEQSLQRALQNNQKLLSAQNEVKISQQRVREAKAGLLPQASLHMSGTHYLAENDYLVASDFGSPVLPPSLNSDADTFYAARVWLRQPLYDGGRLINNVRLARTNLERARIETEEIHLEVVFEATKAFYDVLLCRKQIKLSQDALGDVEKLAAQLAPGDIRRQAEMDALRSRLRRAVGERQRESDKAYLNFINTLGLELYTLVDLDGELLPKDVQADLPRLLAWAQESRLEIRQTDFQKEIDRLTLNLFQAQRYPVVAFGAGYGINDRRFPLRTTEWNTTLSVSLPLFDGFSSRARIREKRMQVNQNRISRTVLEDNINLEVRDTFADLAYWQDEVKVRKGELARAEKMAAELARKKDSLDAALSQEWLLQARTSYWTAVHGQRVSVARLEKTVGRPLEP